MLPLLQKSRVSDRKLNVGANGVMKVTVSHTACLHDDKAAPNDTSSAASIHHARLLNARRLVF